MGELKAQLAEETSEQSLIGRRLHPFKDPSLQQLVQDLHLDGLGRRIRSCLERLIAFLERKSMCDQRFQVNHASRYEIDGFRVSVVIAILETKVDFVGRHMHERECLEVFATADDENHAAKLARLFRGISFVMIT